MSANVFAVGRLQDAKAVIFSVYGPVLSKEERAFFKEYNPFGFILMGRNCETPGQVSQLTQDLKDVVERNCPILIDQEGGRVQRLKPPVWRQYPPAKDFGDLATEDLDQALSDLRYTTLQMAEDLRACGVNVTCAPVLDVLSPQTHDVIGDRGYSDHPDLVSRLGLSIARHYLVAGITPVIKHIPGHGRALADSHFELPVVDACAQALDQDLQPFSDLAKSEIGQALWAMSAHITYQAFDIELPATMSESVIDNIIRKRIGFQGILVSDDVEMKALAQFGDLGQRCALSLSAGCDLALYCGGDLGQMKKIAESVSNMASETIKRLQNAAEFTKLAA